MVLKSIKHGVEVHGPPYTKAEEREFYIPRSVTRLRRFDMTHPH